MTGREYADRLAAELGLPPFSDSEAAALLELASVAAHASERLAAPLCTYLAGRAGRPAGEVRALAERLAG